MRHQIRTGFRSTPIRRFGLGLIIVIITFFTTVQGKNQKQVDVSVNITYKFIQKIKLKSPYQYVSELKLTEKGDQVLYVCQSHLPNPSKIRPEKGINSKTQAVVMRGNQAITPQFREIYTMAISPDGETVAYIYSSEAQKKYVGYNQKRLASSAAVLREVDFSVYRPRLLISPNGKKIAYKVVAIEPEIKNYIMLNEKKILIPGNLNDPKAYIGAMVFDRNSNFFWCVNYRKKWQGNHSVVYNEESKPLLQKKGHINYLDLYWPKDQKVYTLQNGTHWYLMREKQGISPKLKSIKKQLSFSKNGKNYVYAAKKRKWFVMKNKQKYSDLYDEVGFPVLSNKGKKVAFAAQKNNFWFVMLNNEAISPSFKEGYPCDLIFTPNGKKVIYKLKIQDFLDPTNNQEVLMSNGKKISPKCHLLDFKITKEGRIIFAGYQRAEKLVIHAEINSQDL